MGVYQSQYMQNATTSHPKIIGIGKNYLKLSQGVEIPQLPKLFNKPWTTVTFNPKKVYLPAAQTHKIIHQIELGVFICKGGKKIPKQNAFDHIGGYFLAIDFTDLDWFKIERQKGITIPFVKAQDDFCPISQLIAKNVNPYQIELQLKVNGKIRQKDKAKNMFFKIDDIISLISQQIRLEPGDLILTGTPDGSQPVRSGDQVEVYGRVGQTLLAKMEFQVSIEQKP